MCCADIAGRVNCEPHWIGGIIPPREFVLMVRAAIALVSVFAHLKTEVSRDRFFLDLIENFEEK
jgi:hypothetical protein